MPYPKHILEAYTAYLAAHKTKNPTSIFVPKDQIPVWDESQRYARAGLQGQTNNIQEAEGANIDTMLPVVGLSQGGQIYINPSWRRTFNRPSDIINPLAHEMSHDLVTRISKITGEDEETIAAKAVQKLGPYTPMTAFPASNQFDNYGEQLAERVQQPYTDAAEIARKFKELNDQNQFQNYVPAPSISNYFNPSNIS